MSLAEALVKEARWQKRVRLDALQAARVGRARAARQESLRSWCQTVKPRPRGPGED